MLISEPQAAGLFIRGSDRHVPLTGVRIRVVGHGAAALVTVSQRYVNDSPQPIEAVYSFPLEESSTVCSFKVETGGRVIVGKVEEREKAFEQYDDALAEGNSAFLVDQNRPNIFTASVGNLRPGQQATIELSYATELQQHGDAVRVIPSHPAQVEMQGNTALVTLMGEAIQLDRDVVVNVTLAQPHAASAVVAVDGGDGSRAVMLNFFPDLNQTGRLPSEFLFIVDRSGSMAGESIKQARNALLLALRSLDEGDRFNVIGFGSSTEQLFKDSVVYAQQTLDEATQKLAKWDADLGGTELIKPLTLALAESTTHDMPRQVMLLTDGQVGNEDACIALAGKFAATARIFTFGIGYGASEFLVRGLARASGGQAEFIQPNERIEPIVMRQFARAASPFWKDVRIDWGTLHTDLIAPHKLPALFHGDRLTVYGRVSGGASGEVAIVAESPAGPVRIPLLVDLASASDAPAVPALMARRAIQELEEAPSDSRGSNQRERKAQSNRARILELALRYQLMSSQTSFIAIEELAEIDKVTQRPVLKRVPVALTKGWGDVHIAFCMAAPSGGAASVDSMILGESADCVMMECDSDESVVIKPRRLRRSSAPRFDDMAKALHQKKRGIGEFVSDCIADAGSFVSRIAGGSGNDSDVIVLGEYTDAGDLLQHLTSKQQASGCFVLEDDDLELLSVNAAHWQAWLNAVQSATAVKNRLVASTLAALVLLEGRFAARRDEWQMIADKAERWLAKASLVLPAGESSAQEWAKKMLKV